MMVTVTLNPGIILEKIERYTEQVAESKRDWREKNDPLIRAELKNMLYHLDASRVSVMEFHNGKSNPSGLGIHPMTPDKDGMADFDRAVSCRHADGESYGIPYGALVPRGIENMLVAGRCIGADRAMQASVRVIPGCYVTGQAAGVAAAILARENISARAVSPAQIRRILGEIYS